MAILIGVIALAVIPNIGRSRESKDLQTLDNILSSTNTAIANTKTATDGGFSIASGTYTAGTKGTTVCKAVSDELGTITLGAGVNDGKTINVKWTVDDTGAAKVQVYTGTGVTDTTNGVDCKYTQGDNGTTAYMFVSN